MVASRHEARLSVLDEIRTKGDSAVAAELVRMLHDDPRNMANIRRVADEEYAVSGFSGKVAVLRAEAIDSAVQRRLDGAAELSAFIA
jgi:hypothetical protein